MPVTFGKSIFISVTMMVVVGLAACASGSGSGDRTVAAETETVEAKQASVASGTECRRIRKTGTRIKEKVCKSQSEWERQAEQDQAALRRTQQDQSVQNADGN